MNRTAMRCVVLVWVLLHSWPTPGEASSDIRLAFLVGHQDGWEGESHLKNVIKGDLIPMQRALESLGYETILSINQNAHSVRKSFAKIHHILRARKVSTFLFYYTGHADKEYFHLGPVKSKALSYKKLIHLLSALPTKRRFAIIDACYSGEITRLFGNIANYRRRLQRGDKLKGIARQVGENLKKYLARRGSSSRVLSVITSGPSPTFESARYKASIFTHHLLAGLKGAADTDNNGKITFYELYEYTNRKLEQEEQVKASKYMTETNTGESYPFAFVYTSRLLLPARLKGKLLVSIGNFLWSKTKNAETSVRIGIIAGKGIVHMTQKGRCFRQSFEARNHQEVVLRNEGWKALPCRFYARALKGRTLLQATASPPLPRSLWSFNVQGGFSLLPLPSPRFLGGGRISLRHRFFAIALGLSGASLQYSDRGLVALQTELLFEGGYLFDWEWISVSVGAFIGLALLLQDDATAGQTGIGPLFRYGVQVTPVLWLARHWGVILQANVGFALGVFGNTMQHLLSASATVGIRYAL